MATLDDLTAQLAALEKARASGALRVRHGDTDVTYRSIDDIRKAIADIEGAIAALNGTQRKPRYVYQPDKGNDE